MILQTLPFAHVEPILFQARGAPPAFLLGYRHVFRIAAPSQILASGPSAAEEDLAFEVVEDADEAPRVTAAPPWFAAPAS